MLALSILIVNILVFMSLLMIAAGIFSEEELSPAGVFLGTLFFIIVFAFQYTELSSLKSKEMFLLKYIVDNNLSNKEIESKFKKDIKNIKLEEFKKSLNEKN